MRKSATAVRNLGLGFDAIVTSPKLRAMQTAEAVAMALGLPNDCLTVSESVKATTRPEETMEFLRTLGAESVLITGHLPNLERLASQLISGHSRLRLGIENGGLLRIDAERLPTDTAQLRWMLSPMQLQLIAGR